MHRSCNNPGLCFNVSAPGKVILYGEHSVVHDKLAVAASLGLRTYLHFDECPSSDNIHFEIPAVNLEYSVNFTVLQQWMNYLLEDNGSTITLGPDLLDHAEVVTSVQSFLKSNSKVEFNEQQLASLTGIFYLLFGILHSVNELKPFTVKLGSDLTLGAGTGSSASFAVTVAAAFVYYKHFKLLSAKLTTFSDDEKSLISKWAYCIEKINHGLPSGIDNAICTYGSMVMFRKSEGMQLMSTCEFQLLLINTEVSRSTKQILNNVIALMQNHKAVIDSVMATMDLIAKSAVSCIIEITNDVNNPILYQRLGELTHINQCMLESLGASHPTIDKICSILKASGLNGKLTGAGGGGYVIAIIPPYVSKNLLNDLIEQLNSEGFRTNLTKLGGLGVSIS
uniref:Mevalonate kinase n=1 Tax=Photinus pyralis TaxID=7054 RepID=A0A1Y1MYH1_PHOPY